MNNLAGTPVPTGQRRTFLEVLAQVIGERYPGLRSGLVVREGCMVLFVINSVNASRKTEIGCDFDNDEGWTFTWATDGRTIEPVDGAASVADAIAHHLQVEARVRS